MSNQLDKLEKSKIVIQKLIKINPEYSSIADTHRALMIALDLINEKLSDSLAKSMEN